MADSPPSLHPRKPWLAALTSVFFPGLGLVYAGSLRSAVGWALAPTAASLTVAAILSWVVVPRASLILIIAVLLGSMVLGANAAWRAALRAPRPFIPTPLNRGWVYVAGAALLTLGNASFHKLVFQPFFVQAFTIPGRSMEPSLLAGDYVWVLKARHAKPTLDALVVFESVDDVGVLLIKRIVALPGDTIAIQSGVVFRNGKSLGERHQITAGASATVDTAETRELAALRHRLNPTASVPWTLNNWGPIVVPASEMFVLGDNLDDSYDSRYYGPVPIDRIRGRPRLVYFSKDSSGIRWKRLGQSLISPCASHACWTR